MSGAMRVELVIYEEWENRLRELRDWILITGFPGFGHVGSIATRYIASKLGTVKVGDIFSRYMPDFTALEDYGIMTPYEIFADFNRRILIVVNNAVPQPPERLTFAKKLVEWFVGVGGSKAILAGGLNSKFRKGEEEFRWLCVNSCGWEFKEPVIDKGLYIVGPLAMLFMVLKVRKVPTLVVLPYTEPGKYDPKAAAVFVRKVSEILNLGIDVSDLLTYSKLLEETEAALEEALKTAERRERGPRPYM